MKISLSTCAMAVAALLAGNAMAGDSPSKDGPRGVMRADTNGDGKVSKDEVATLQEKMQTDWFDKADSDKDGFLTEQELRDARGARREHRRGEMKEHMEQRFKEADANGDGQLSLDEAQAKLPRLAEKFNALDADKNGMLSKDELKRPGSHGGPKPQE